MVKERVKYYDTLRALAIIAVVMLHIFKLWPQAEIMHFKVVYFIEITRFGVPTFLLLSGALLLNRKIDLEDFFKRRFTRLIYPFIFYLIPYAILLYVLINYCTGFSILSKYWADLPFIYNWYFWMILGAYLALPIINKFVQHANKKEMEYFILIFLLSSIFYQLSRGFGIKHFIDLTFILSPVGYMVFGYYLANTDFVKDFNLNVNTIIYIALFLFAITTIIKILGYGSVLPIEFTKNNVVARTEILASYMDYGIFQIIQAGSVFVLFRYIYQAKEGISSYVRRFLELDIVNKANVSLSRASYGVYLLHTTLLRPFKVIVSGTKFSGSMTCLVIIFTTFCLVVVSWAIVLLLNRIPFINKFTGYH